MLFVRAAIEDLDSTLRVTGRTAPSARAMHQRPAERFVHREGTEVMRQLYESWLCGRADAEPVGEVEGSDHLARTHHRSASRTMESLFGTVTVARDRLGARGAAALAPSSARSPVRR